MRDSTAARPSPPLLALLLLAPAALAACRPDAQTSSPSLSPSARPGVVESLRRDLATERHPSDGGGRAWLEPAPASTLPARVGEPGRFSLVYEAGPLGIAEGGWLLLQVSPFWGWSTPQVELAEAPGYTEVSTDAAGVELAPRTLDQQLLGIEIRGRALREGERVRIHYGAGPAGAEVDRFAERRSRLFIGVDGDGDGVRALIADSPAVEVLPGPPARLVLLLPSTAHPGETVRLHLSVVDRLGNAGVDAFGEVALFGPPELDLPPAVRFEPAHRGHLTVELVAPEVPVPGVVRVAAEGLGLPPVESNPLVVSAEGPRLLWADLHGHSALSDGTGTPEDYYAYARDIAALDVAALTDHDHWGMEPLSHHPELWQEIRAATESFNEPGRFVTLLGYEWTSWLHGHRHVLYFRDQGRVLSSVDPAYESPEQLWEALRGEPALTFAHHSAGGPIATNWEIAPDPELEPVTEIVSVHGSSEGADSPGLIYDPIAGNFVRDALERGYLLGFIGSGDGHDGHPGLAGLASPSAGLAAILSEERTRAGVLAALRSRRVYATNGPRILLSVSLDGRPMGSTLEPAPGETQELVLRIVAAAPLERLDLIRSGGVTESVPAGGQSELSSIRRVAALAPGEYLYVRAVQEDGGAAWSSPFFCLER